MEEFPPVPDRYTTAWLKRRNKNLEGAGCLEFPDETIPIHSTAKTCEGGRNLPIKKIQMWSCRSGDQNPLSNTGFYNKSRAIIAKRLTLTLVHRRKATVIGLLSQQSNFQICHFVKYHCDIKSFFRRIMLL